jgi:hypothetical protein
VPTISDPVTTGRASAVERAVAALPTAGLSLLSVGSLLILLLHVLPPSNRVNPMTRTISEYALGANGWMFDLGVLALAVGSMVVLAGLVRTGVVRAIGGTSVFITFWSASLTVLVIFEKYDFQNGQHTGASGMIHRMASLVAFLSLPLAVLLASRGAARRNPGWRRPAAWTRWAGIVSCACLSLLIYAIVRGLVTDVSWWRVFPLGAMERLIALSDILAVSVLGVWARMARTVAAEALVGSAGLADQVSDGPGGAALVQ